MLCYTAISETLPVTSNRDKRYQTSGTILKFSLIFFMDSILESKCVELFKILFVSIRKHTLLTPCLFFKWNRDFGSVFCEKKKRLLELNVSQMYEDEKVFHETTWPTWWSPK